MTASTKVRESHLAALETEDFDALGGDVYVRGFITAYARFVGLDPAPLLEALRQHRADQEPVPRSHWRWSSSHGQLEPGGMRIRTGRVAVLIALVLVVVVGLVLAGLWGDGDAAARALTGVL